MKTFGVNNLNSEYMVWLRPAVATGTGKAEPVAEGDAVDAYDGLKRAEEEGKSTA